ncbi:MULTISPECIES: prephenate dehydratase [unclassified Sinorhizobium]|uniref:prephenate dehydratase n=1 Tax=unclassified Sinorhizobium TaxID=2613772 RepID=UPI003524FD27
MNKLIRQPPIIDASDIKKVGFIGPEGTWTHQATLELFSNGPGLVPFKDGLFEAYASGMVDAICAPVTTSLVGTTPYLDQILALPSVTVIAEYPRMLSYSLIASKDATFSSITKVLGHPVALEEVRAWIDENMPGVERESRLGTVAYVAEENSPKLAAFGPGLGAKLYDLQELRTGIEEGLHNVTRWWVLGKDIARPTGFDRTTIVLRSDEASISSQLATFLNSGLSILNIYERPTRERLDIHQYVIDFAGHVEAEPQLAQLVSRDDIRMLGSYPRKY